MGNKGEIFLFFLDSREKYAYNGLTDHNYEASSAYQSVFEKGFLQDVVTVCGKFVPDEGVVAGYDNRIRDKSPAKWGVQIAGMIFQTRSNMAHANWRPDSCRINFHLQGEGRRRSGGYGD